MTELDTPVRYQVAAEIQNALRLSPVPLTTHQILNECPSAESVDRLAKTVWSLKKRGAVVEDAAVETPAGPRKTYRLPTEEERLMAHLEADLETRTITEEEGVATIRYPLSKVMDEEPGPVDSPIIDRRSGTDRRAASDCLDCAECSCNGDEHAHTARPLDPDPVIKALERMTTHPCFPHAEQYAMRMVALSAHLGQGYSIHPDPDIHTFLTDCARVFAEWPE